MVRVLIFVKSALENGRGGEISLIELATGLKRYFEIDIIDTNRIDSKKLLPQKEIQEKLKGLIRRAKLKLALFRISGKIFDFPYPWELAKLYKIMKNYDIIYTTSGNNKFNLFFALYGLLNPNIKFIIGHRKPLYTKKKLSLYNIRIWLTILIFSIFKKNFFHHTISFHAKKYLEKFFNGNHIIHIIHGIELENFNIKKKEDKNLNRLNFIYVGNIDDPHKGVGVLLDAIETLLEEQEDLDIFFEFCGKGPLESRLKKLEKKYPEYIKFNGFVSYKEIPKYYLKSDVLLFSSRREPFGRVLIEALTSGLIVICSKTIGSIEILKGKKFGFFIENFSSKGFKDKIMEVYEKWKKEPEDLRNLQSFAREYAIKNYSFDEELKGFKNFIEKLILSR